MNTNDAVKCYDRIGDCLHNGSAVEAAWHVLVDAYRGDDDPNLEKLKDVYHQALSQKIPYWDVRAAVWAVAHVIRPATYLEVGTRRGWSLAQVFAECPDVRAVVVDQWIENYGGLQGTPEFLQKKMQAVVGAGHTPKLEFLSGNSHDVLPTFFNYPTSLTYGDLITVDGDHTRLGAWWDLTDLFPHVAVGGAIVFDDLECVAERETPQARNALDRLPMPAHFDTLQDIWDYMKSMYPGFAFQSCTTLKYRAGVAVRLF
jgi:hypothetical protein